jgi:hypothetical protein
VRNCFGGGPDEHGIIYRRIAEGAHIARFMPEFGEQGFDLLLVIEPGVVRAYGDFHAGGKSWRIIGPDVRVIKWG